MIRCPADTPAVPPVAAGALQLMPPAAYAHQPATSFAIKFAGQAPSKTRSSINVAVWTPDGRRCLTGTQVGGLAGPGAAVRPHARACMA